MHIAKTFAGAAALVCFALVPAYPAQRGNSGNHGPSTTKQGPSTTSHGPTKTTTKATGAPIAKGPSAKPTTKPVKTETRIAKTDHVKAAKVDATSVKSKKTGTTTTTAANGTSTTTGTSTTGTSTTAPTKTTIDFTTTALGQKLAKNTSLSSKLQTRLEALGYKGTVAQAAYGFKNLGQLNAATNQVQNQGYSFNLLKVLMTGTYVDPQTHVVYRANQLPDGTVTLVRARLATNPASTQSLGQAKQAIAGGAEMPTVVRIPPPPTGTHIPPPTGTATTSR